MDNLGEVECPECFGYGDAPPYLEEDDTIGIGVCPVCGGKGRILENKE